MCFLMCFWVGLLVVVASILVSFWCHFGCFFVYFWCFFLSCRRWGSRGGFLMSWEVFLPPPTHAEVGFTSGIPRFERMKAFGVQWSVLLPESPKKWLLDLLLGALGALFGCCFRCFFEPIFGECFLKFFVILGLLLGPSWGTLGGKSSHFGTPFWRFPTKLPLWGHFKPFWVDLGAFWEHFGRIWGSIW